ncbi:protein obstructor-E-like [Artemia franciscana]|uniref:protein obstructor-E-like n=1 Tax=Artemia franciscana TaxID=6661 RepID=UPI0032D9AF7E
MYKLFFVVIVVLYANIASSGEEVPVVTPIPGPLSLTVVTECLNSSSPYYVADRVQCDKFYECQYGKKKPFLCPDGTVFDFPTQSCILLQFSKCEGRPLLQKPKGTSPFCPRLNGIHPHPDKSVCDRYYICTNNKPTEAICSGGLVFDPRTGVCTYADLAGRPECKGRGFLTSSLQPF